jgi:hypothetical protein
MLESAAKKIELIANVAIIVIACLLATVLVRQHLFAKPAEVSVKEQPAGPRASSPSVTSLDINWAANRQTLILAISSSCHFCTASAPFYQKLVQNKSKTKLIAVLPQSVQEGENYLKRLGVAVDEVRQLDFNQIGVQGTPTLLLVDRSGVIRNSWVGKLPSDKESVVPNALLSIENN